MFMYYISCCDCKTEREKEVNKRFPSIKKKQHNARVIKTITVI